MMVMVSIIIGLGITELLAGSARLLRERAELKPYWLHVVAVIGVFLTHMVIWWETWGLRAVDNWTFPGMLFLLVAPIGLYMIASLMFPDDIKGCDFRTYTYKNATLVWGIAGTITFLATALRPILFGHQWIDIDNLPSLVQILIAITLCSTKRPAVHSVLIPLFFIIVVADQLIFRYFINSF